MIYAEERYNNIMRLLTDKGRISLRNYLPP